MGCSVHHTTSPFPRGKVQSLPVVRCSSSPQQLAVVGVPTHRHEAKRIANDYVNNKVL
jgi:hypothetical protein